VVIVWEINRHKNLDKDLKEVEKEMVEMHVTPLFPPACT
jgi:hypothetical protein